MIRFFPGPVLALLLFTSAGTSQDLDAGTSAYKAGDFVTALREWRPLAEHGDPAAQSNLGFMYDQGAGVPQDYSEAAKWYRLAAEQGQAMAQNRLGDIYLKGKGFTPDYAEAARWFRLSAGQGNATAQNNLGVMYSNGLGVSQNQRTAHMWFNIAGANGNPEGVINRDRAALGMPSADLLEAQRGAKVCMDSTYSTCDLGPSALEKLETAAANEAKTAAATAMQQANKEAAASDEAEKKARAVTDAAMAAALATGDKRLAQKLADQAALGAAISRSEGDDGNSKAGQHPPLSSGEIDGLRVAIKQCWNLGTLSSAMMEVTVTVRMDVGQDRKPVFSSIRMTRFEGGAESVANKVFEAARSAIFRCGRSGLPLPPEKYDTWKMLELVFDPRGMRLR